MALYEPEPTKLYPTSDVTALWLRVYISDRPLVPVLQLLM